jgi:SAM-dependent methyltransferase
MLYEQAWNPPDLTQCFWYHTLDLPDGQTVPGQWDLRGRFGDYTGQVEMAGKRVLDIGTANGFLTWEAEKAGASVVSFDLDHARRQKLLPFREQVYFRDRAESERQREEFFNAMKRGYWYMHHALGSQARVYYGDIENLPAELGGFDVALLCSILEHLPDHIQAIASAAARAKMLVITGPLNETDACVAEFAGRASVPSANFSFWRYSLGVYREVLGMLGFGIDRITRAAYPCLLNQTQVELPTIVASRIT